MTKQLAVSDEPSETMQSILDKNAMESTSLEHAICILWLSEQTKGKPLAEEAAAELAALRERLAQAEEESNIRRENFELMTKRLIAIEAERDEVKAQKEEYRKLTTDCVVTISNWRDLVWEALNNPEFGLSEYGHQRFEAALESPK